MGIHDRDWQSGEGGGRLRAVLGRMFGDTENPLGWALTLFVVAGIRVRLSIWFIIFAAGQLIWSISGSAMGIGYAAISMATLFLIVLLHEFGHCIACRMVGGDADDILMWPLGGLASCRPPDHWRADFITTAGGPFVNLLLLPVTSGALWVAGHRDAIVFNPLQPGVALGTIGSFWGVTLFWAHYMNIVLFAFNVFLPMFPLDGGRMAQALLWAKVGRRESLRIATNVGIVAAIALAVLALPTGRTMILGIAIFCGLICWMEKQRLKAESDLSFLPPEPSFSHRADPESAARRARKASKQAKRVAAEQAEIDRILEKIAESGMHSLTSAEKKTLQRATKKQRDG